MNNNKLLILSFGLFGLTALIFQVVFAKQLVLLFGLTAPAIATVLAVYFSGLAIGSIFIGKLVDKFQKMAGRIYLFLFLLTGIYGISFPFLFPLLNKVILAINSVYPLNFSGFNFFAFLLAFLFLIFPAICIGGGFPTVNKLFIRKEEKLGSKVSVVYFVETFGNVIGVLLAGFWLIPAFGNNATIIFAAVLNLLIAGALFIFFKSLPQFGEVRPPNITQSREVEPPNIKGIQNPIFLYALFLTGFLALALEVLYTKTLILFIGSSTYAFSLILITFLLGIALGSLVISWFADKITRGYAYFGMFLGLIGFWLFLTLQFFEKLPFWFLQALGSYDSFEFGAILFSQSLITFIVIFPATFLMGMVFPLGIKLAAPDLQKLGQGIGKLYFANTFGGVLGSLTAGFLLLPSIGYSRTLTLILFSYFLLGGVFIVREKDFGRIMKVITAFFFVFWMVFAFFSHPWGKKNLTVGSFVYAPIYLNYGIDVVRETIERDEILFYKEGLSNVAVMQRGPNRILKVNGKVDASNSLDDLETMVLTGALPMILHSNPEDVLVIGLGSGITLGAVTQFDSAKNIDMVEIDPKIVEAADYFKKDNHDALHDPRVKTILADGRNYLLLTDKKYDVISSQPSNIWVEGNSNLFTKEYYELAKSRLKENGLMFQWIQAYSLTPENVRSVYKTFQEVFPQVYLFNSSNSGDMFMLGVLRKDSAILNFDALSEKMSDPKIAAEFQRIYIMNPYELLAYLVTEGDRFREFASSAKVNTDNKNFLEFSAPKSIYKATISEALRDVDFLREELNLFVFGLEEDESLERLKKYFEFRKALLPAQAALSEGRLFDAVENYTRARDLTGLILPSVEARIMQGCNVAALFAQQDEGAEAAKRVWKRCEEAFGTIEVEVPN